MSRIDVQKLIQGPTSKFLIVMCPSCGNKQVVFNHVKTRVQCRVCKSVLAEPTGGKAKILGKVERELD